MICIFTIYAKKKSESKFIRYRFKMLQINDAADLFQMRSYSIASKFVKLYKVISKLISRHLIIHS